MRSELVCGHGPAPQNGQNIDSTHPATHPHLPPTISIRPWRRWTLGTNYHGHEIPLQYHQHICIDHPSSHIPCSVYIPACMCVCVSCPGTMPHVWKTCDIPGREASPAGSNQQRADPVSVGREDHCNCNGNLLETYHGTTQQCQDHFYPPNRCETGGQPSARKKASMELSFFGLVGLLTSYLWSTPPPPPPPTMLESYADSIVEVSGWVGFCLSLLITQMPTARSMAILQAINNFTYVIHFGMLGAWGGLSTQVIGVVNSLLKIGAEGGSSLCSSLQRFTPLALIPLGAYTYKSPLDLLPLSATGGRLLSYQIEDMFRMRLVQLLAYYPWVPYALAYGSNSMLMTALLSIALQLFGIFKHHPDLFKAKVEDKVKAKASPAKASPAKASPAKASPAKDSPAKDSPAQPARAAKSPVRTRATPAKATPAKPKAKPTPRSKAKKMA